MYPPPRFEETRPEEIQRLIAAHPLGTLVAHGPAGFDAVHLPFLADLEPTPHGRLLAHISRTNPLWQAHRAGGEVLVVFHGPEAYVSPNWYPDKATTHREVPTWNYQAVHCHGTLQLHDDPRFVRGLIARLTRAQEVRAGEAVPWRLGDAPPEYVSALLPEIVGVEIAVRRVTAFSKLSQNRSARDRGALVEALQVRGAGDVAAAMVSAPVRARPAKPADGA